MFIVGMKLLYIEITDMKKAIIFVAAMLCAFIGNAQTAESQAILPVDGKFILPQLPYASDALEPVISMETVRLHYGKHFKGYIDNLNRLIQGTELQGKTLVEVVQQAQGGTFNNAGQSLNHLLYFNQFMSPVENNRPDGELLERINAQFGSFEAFVKEFNGVATGLFGSGWVFLSVDKDGKLCITKEANAGNPVVDGLKPILAVDVWEHAYYLDYKNLRAKHLEALWSIVNWDVVAGRL